jgi:hypothetical protein
MIHLGLLDWLEDAINEVTHLSHHHLHPTCTPRKVYLARIDEGSDGQSPLMGSCEKPTGYLPDPPEYADSGRSYTIGTPSIGLIISD